jgi:hypothetical protein
MHLFILWLLMLAVEDILEAFNRWKFKETLPADAHKKVSVRLLSGSAVVWIVWSNWGMELFR